MRKVYSVLLAVFMVLLLTACGSTADNDNAAKQTAAPTAQSNSKQAENSATNPKDDVHKILVAYFSRTGENYKVGFIEKGNTHIMADMIAEMTGADTFEIKTVTPYPSDYDECTKVAAKELEDNARPALQGSVINFADYDTIFLGYPIWWSDMPMAVYTFMESYDWQGKTIIPFCTSAGDVLTGKESDIPRYAKGASVLEGLGLEGKRVQENSESARPEIAQWLEKLGLKK